MNEKQKEITTLQQKVAELELQQLRDNECIERIRNHGMQMELERDQLKQECVALDAKVERLKSLEKQDATGDMDYNEWLKEWNSIIDAPTPTALKEFLKPVEQLRKSVSMGSDGRIEIDDEESFVKALAELKGLVG
jgi:hypothetical protein